MENLFLTVAYLLKSDERFFTTEGKLIRNSLYEAAMKMDASLIKVLLGNDDTRKQFFNEVDIDGKTTYVFDKVEFGWFVNNKEFLPDSYTRFKNKIGLAEADNKIITAEANVSLIFPYKDCMLEGGQLVSYKAKDEIFYNKVLQSKMIDRLTMPKVLINAKRYTVDRIEKVSSFHQNDNLIIKGNNLLALHSLGRYTNSIKTVFIDPPYFFLVNKPSDTFSYNSNFKLSSWLVFMKNRLEIARTLLRKDGVLFLTMSDDGAHYLKVLTDSIFGMENFIADVTWESRKSISSDGLMSLNSNHVLIYAKDINCISKNDFRLALDIETFTQDDNDGRGKYRLEPFDAPGIRPNLTYEIINPNTNKIYMPARGRCWRTEKVNYDKYMSDNRIRFGVQGTAGPQLKVYYDEVKEAGKGKASSTIWHDIKNSIIWQDLDTNTNATKDQMELFGKVVFTNPKPEDLVKRALELSTNKGDIVLDFFMGSGTTQAVALKMGRQFIGIEQLDYIEDVSVERLKKVIEGEQTGISKDVNWQGGGSFVYCELAQLNQKFVDELQDADTDEKVKDILVRLLKSGFISDRVNPKLIDVEAPDFNELTLAEKKDFVMQVLDANMLYVNYSDIDDEEFKISEEDKAFTKSFYGEE